MRELQKNVINTFGERGKAWLQNLPQIIQKLQKYWNLKEIHPVSNMSYHFVAKAIKDIDHLVVLKIGCDKALIEREASALRHFAGSGSIALLDHNHEQQALLLQQAIPGTTLKALYPQQVEFVMSSYVSAMKKIHDHPFLQGNPFPSLNSWLEAIDRVHNDKIPGMLLGQALEIKKKLQASKREEKLLHGDLHLDNILCNNDEWLCIDPKGVIGEPEFEIAAFDFIDKSELHEATSKLFLTRIEQMAHLSGFSFERIKDWVFVRLILSAAWSIEDQSDPDSAIKLATWLGNN